MLCCEKCMLLTHGPRCVRCVMEKGESFVKLLIPAAFVSWMNSRLCGPKCCATY